MIGIIGQGFVGNAVYQKFKKYYEVKTFDLNVMKRNTSFEDVARCDYVFVCVPTPMNSDGSCNTDIVEGVIKEIDEIGETKGIVVKSTIPPMTTEKWNEKYKTNIVFSPTIFMGNMCLIIAKAEQKISKGVSDEMNWGSKVY